MSYTRFHLQNGEHLPLDQNNVSLEEEIGQSFCSSQLAIIVSCLTVLWRTVVPKVCAHSFMSWASWVLITAGGSCGANGIPERDAARPGTGCHDLIWLGIIKCCPVCSLIYTLLHCSSNIPRVFENTDKGDLWWTTDRQFFTSMSNNLEVRKSIIYLC